MMARRERVKNGLRRGGGEGLQSLLGEMTKTVQDLHVVSRSAGTHLLTV